MLESNSPRNPIATHQADERPGAEWGTAPSPPAEKPHRLMPIAPVFRMEMDIAFWIDDGHGQWLFLIFSESGIASPNDDVDWRTRK